MANEIRVAVAGTYIITTNGPAAIASAGTVVWYTSQPIRTRPVYAKSRNVVRSTMTRNVQA